MTYREAAEELAPLLADFAGSDVTGAPFWRLQNDQVWVVQGAQQLPTTSSGDVLTSALTDVNTGDFPAPYAGLVQRAPAVRRQAIEVIAGYLSPDIRAEVLRRHGLSAPEPTVASRPAAAGTSPDAARVLRRLVGTTVKTVTGCPNLILAVSPPDVLVATGRSPHGQPVPIAQVQAALDQLAEAGEAEISVPALGHAAPSSEQSS